MKQRLPYTAPALESLGSIETLTQTGGISGNFDGGTTYAPDAPGS